MKGTFKKQHTHRCRRGPKFSNLRLFLNLLLFFFFFGFGFCFFLLNLLKKNSIEV